MNDYNFQMKQDLVSKQQKHIKWLERRNAKLLARVDELEARLASAAITGKGSCPSEELAKHNLAQQIKALEDCVGVCGFLSCEDSLIARIKQLHKGGE